MHFIQFTGKFQTDQLEARFGKYRRLAGCNYNISIRQIFECKQKIRLMSILKIPINNREIEIKHFEEISTEDENMENAENKCVQSIEIDEGDIQNCDEVIPVIAYIAGYCCYKINNKLQCSECKDILCINNECGIVNDKLDYVTGISRGSLLYPRETTMNIVMYSYIVTNKLLSDVNILNSRDLRKIIIDTTINALNDNAIGFSLNICANGHSFEKITGMILWASCNILLNNFCKRENDLMVTKKLHAGRKRKLKTLKKMTLL